MGRVSFFMKVLMKALRRTYYAGKWLEADTEFEAEAVLVPLLKATKAAIAIEPKPKKGEYKRRDMRAES